MAADTRTNPTGKPVWHRLGSVLVYDTDNKGAKLRDKKGNAYRKGSGFLEMPDGTTVKVFVTVKPSPRAGSEYVELSVIPKDSQ